MENRFFTSTEISKNVVTELAAEIVNNGLNATTNNIVAKYAASYNVLSSNKRKECKDSSIKIELKKAITNNDYSNNWSELHTNILIQLTKKAFKDLSESVKLIKMEIKDENKAARDSLVFEDKTLSRNVMKIVQCYSRTNTTYKNVEAVFKRVKMERYFFDVNEKTLAYNIKQLQTEIFRLSNISLTDYLANKETDANTKVLHNGEHVNLSSFPQETLGLWKYNKESNVIRNAHKDAWNVSLVCKYLSDALLNCNHKLKLDNE